MCACCCAVLFLMSVAPVLKVSVCVAVQFCSLLFPPENVKGTPSQTWHVYRLTRIHIPEGGRFTRFYLLVSQHASKYSGPPSPKQAHTHIKTSPK